MIAVDQYGRIHRVDPKRPRASLCADLGVKHAERMYVDAPDGAKHVGYVIAGLWLTLYTAWERPA